MSISADAGTLLDGLTAGELAGRLAVPRVDLYPSVSSTLDVAHALGAQDTPAGTVIVADEQTAGRGRLGRRWTSAPGAGLWLTLVERPRDLQALDVLALRVGLYVAQSLDTLAGSPVSVKWPNDLYMSGRKLGGVLIEIRWRGPMPDWVAIGLGINVLPPDVDTGTGLSAGVTRLEVLECVVPAVRRAARCAGHLSLEELSAWTTRDAVRGREISEPGAGTVLGISPSGELLVEEMRGVGSYRSGSVIFA